MPASNSSKSTGAPDDGIAEHLAPLIAAQPGLPTGRITTLEEARRALSIPTSAAPEVLHVWGVPNDHLVAFRVSDQADADLVAEFAALLVVHRDNGRLRGKPPGVRLRLAAKGNSLWVAYGSIVKAIDKALVIGDLNLGPAFDLQAGKEGNDAALGITAELLRLLSPNKLLSQSIDYLERHRRISTITARQAATQQATSAPTADEKPLGRGRRTVVTDELLAEMAMSYIALYRNGCRQPLPLLAIQFGIDRSQARDRIHKARQQGWLTTGAERRAGGEPGPRLIASGWQPPEFDPSELMPTDTADQNASSDQ